VKRVTLDLSQVQDPAVRAALQEIIRASTQNVLEDVAQSGAALVTIKNAAANQVPYFTGPATCAAGTVPDAALKSTSFVFVNRNGSTQSGVVSGVFTKVQFTNKVIDPQNAFDATTNYRYQPAVAGKYLVTSSLFITNNVATTSLILSLYKNGAEFFRMLQAVVSTGWVANASCIVDLNGSTDYVELFGFQNSGSNQAFGAANDVLLWMTAQRIGP
jgi:hypothetical protein